MDGFDKLRAFEALRKRVWTVGMEASRPRLDMVYGQKPYPGQAIALKDDPHVRFQRDQLRDAYGYRKIEGKSPAAGERRSSDEERVYVALCQILRTARDRSQAAWFYRDQEVQYFGPHVFEICNRGPMTLEKAQDDVEELRQTAHEMEGHGNENVRQFGRQLAEIARGLPGAESVGRTGFEGPFGEKSD